MYVTRPLSWLKSSPKNLSLPTPEGPNSGYLVLCDEESESTYCFGKCKRKTIGELPFPQNKDLRILYSTSYATFVDDVLFVPVLDQPLSSNRYYVVRRGGRHEGQACANSKEEDKCTFCCFSCAQDIDPRPLDPSDIYQQFEIHRMKGFAWFCAKSVAPEGFPPEFLRRKGWQPRMHKPRHYQLGEAQGLNSSLRARLPEFNFSLLSPSSNPVVVGRWYCPFMFVKEEMNLKDQMQGSAFYEMTLEQRWDKIFGRDNIRDDAKVVPIDVVVQREEAFVAGMKAVWDKQNVENGVIWFRSRDNRGEGKEIRVGLNVKIMERMKWEQERAGWVDGDEKQVRVERQEEFRGMGRWSNFGCYVLAERFVLKRMDGRILLAYDFRHIHHIRCKWE